MAEELTPEMRAMLKDIGINKDELPGGQKENGEVLRAQLEHLRARSEKLTEAQDRSRIAELVGQDERFKALQAENAQLREEQDAQATEIKSWVKERNFLRRGIFELYHGEAITMSRARELMGFNTMEPVREMYRRLKPEFDREVDNA